MNKQEWDALPRVVQDQLASKHGLTRSGENNCIITDEELAKIPEANKPEPKKQDEETKEEVREVPTKEISKRSNRRTTTTKSKRGKK